MTLRLKKINRKIAHTEIKFHTSADYLPPPPPLSEDTHLPGHVAQSVTCLATDASLTADPGVASWTPAPSHTFMEIDQEIISTIILLPSLNHSRRIVVSYKRKYVHELLINCLFKLAQTRVVR